MSDPHLLRQGPAHSQAAEWSVIGQLMSGPKRVGEVVGTMLEPDHFYRPDTKLIYDKIVESFFAGDPIDAVTIGEALRTQLSRQWNCQDEEVPGQLHRKVQGVSFTDSVIDHAKLIRRYAMHRDLEALLLNAAFGLKDHDLDPEQVADEVATQAVQVATGGVTAPELVSHGDVGRHHIRHLQQVKAAREQGIELGAYFGLKFLDDMIAGLQPSEFIVCAGEPGSGKSALWWDAGHRFAARQMTKPEERRVGCLILSLEMGEILTGNRIAQRLTKFPGSMIREGELTDKDIQMIAQRWAPEKDIPLYYNFSSTLKASQLRAIIVEAVRRYNVGLVIIDHWRYFQMDRVPRDPLQHDEDKARFIKQDVAKQLNVAVVCLAHTIKLKDERQGRPTMTDLRGSGQISAEVDFLCFTYRPWVYAPMEDTLAGRIEKTDAELIFTKARSNEPQTVPYYFDAPVMRIDDR